jgi:hypothetical protein
MDYKPFRNKIRSFTYDSLTTLLLQSLNSLEKREGLTPFWHPLIILKWTLEFAEDKYPPKQASRNDIIKMLNKIEELEMSHTTFNLSNTNGIRKAMTIFASQQLSYQEPCNWTTFSRQLILFSDTKRKNDINTSFQNHTDLSIIDFLKILYTLWFLAFENKAPEINYYGYISEKMMYLIETVYGKQNLQLFLNLLAISRENIHVVLKADKRQIRNYNLQPFETSIFTRKPLLLFKERYYIPHKNVLKHTSKYFIYEFLKTNDVNFTTEFGSRMEKYVELGLKELNLNYTTENDLKKEIGKTENVVDFIIQENVLIEVKAIEMKPYTSVNPIDDLIENEFRKSIVKAYAKQMLNVINKQNKKTEYFGIIVTYKKLNLGNSKDIWDQFLKEATLKITDVDTVNLLPIENLFFIDLATWDILIQLLKNKTIELVDLLKSVRDADSNFKTKKEWFSMHLDKYNITQIDLQYLTKAFDYLKASV